jgi:hypothetical protein
LRENIFDGATDVRSALSALLQFQTVALLILMAAFGFYVAKYAPDRRARYRQRLENAYSRFDQDGPAHDTEAAASAAGDQPPYVVH